LVTAHGPAPIQRLTSETGLKHSGCTSMHFGENQLSPGSIGISPLPTGHPPVLQHWWVRASTRSYPRFTLPMGSSPGFGSYSGNSLLGASHTLARFRLAFAPAPALYRALTFLLPSRKKGSLLLPYTRRIILQKARRQAVSESRRTRDAALRLLVSAGVQRLFHPPPGVLFTFPSRYWFTIGGQEYPRLGGWSPQLPTGFLVPRGTQDD
jgi:hypothetical protein